MLRIATTMLLLLLSFYATGKDWRWVPVTVSNDDELISIDKQTFREGRFPEFWVQWEKPECGNTAANRLKSTMDYGQSAMQEILAPQNCFPRKAKQKVDCKSREFATLRLIGFNNARQEVIDTGLLRAEFSEVSPGSVGESIIDFVCGSAAQRLLR